MNGILHPGMREATRLTRAGRLIEATELLQRMLHRRGGDPYHASSPGSVPATIDLIPETVEVTDPGPSLHTGQEYNTGARNRAERAGRTYLPEALRRFLDRIPTPTSDPAWAGWQNRLQPTLSTCQKAAYSSQGPTATKSESAPTSSTCRAAIAASPCR